MIQRHAEILRELLPNEAHSLWTALSEKAIVEEPPPPVPDENIGERLVQVCQQLSHATVILSVSDRPGMYWCQLMSKLLRQPIYMCARGETSTPIEDALGRPIPLPIGHRLGQPVALGGISVAVKRKLNRYRKVDTRIIVEVAPNPKQPGSAAFNRYALYEVGMSVDDFIALGGRHDDIRFDANRGFIRLEARKA